jgi:hypothetical protein
MTLQNIILLIIAALNLFFGFYILFKDLHSRLRWSFFAISLAVFFWCLSQAYLYSGLLNKEIILNAVSWSYLAGSLIPISFVFFGYLFPVDISMKKKYIHLLVWPFIILFLSILIDSGFIVRDGIKTGIENVLSYNVFGSVVYLIYFVFYMGLGFYFLIKRYRSLIGILKYQTGIMLFGIGIASVFAAVCSLILPFDNVFNFDLFGPYFSLVMVFSIAYMMFKQSR